jgi:hypothetical protein
MLERTHMYSVDKQQVSIIQVGGEKEKTVAVPISNNNNNEPVLQRSPSMGDQPLSMSLSGNVFLHLTACMFSLHAFCITTNNCASACCTAYSSLGHCMTHS